VSDTPVSTRRVFHTILDLAGLGNADSLRGAEAGVVLGEAMKPFLSFGWQPQVMGVLGGHKAIFAGRLETYDLAADPGEARDLSGKVELPRELALAVRDYPVPSLAPPAPQEQLGEEELKKLASLGYISATSRPQKGVRPDAPRPADMAPLFETIENASGLFVRGEYRRAIPLFEKILAGDPNNLDAALKLASAHSSLGDARRAEAAFERASRIAPDSPDVRTYLALHYARGPQWERAAPLLEQIVKESPDRLPALEALAIVRERQGRAAEAAALRRRAYAMRTPTAAELVRLGELSMSAGETAPAIDAFERARAAQGPAFGRDLELGVLYLDARRLTEARDALDRVPRSHPAYPMALFKRAQVSVLLKEPDAAARIAAARAGADETTRPLIARERLFQGAGAP
jgi:tetratricopeptide (TPR) repeat protein